MDLHGNNEGMKLNSHDTQVDSIPFYNLSYRTKRYYPLTNRPTTGIEFVLRIRQIWKQDLQMQGCELEHAHFDTRKVG